MRSELGVERIRYARSRRVMNSLLRGRCFSVTGNPGLSARKCRLILQWRLSTSGCAMKFNATDFGTLFASLLSRNCKRQEGTVERIRPLLLAVSCSLALTTSAQALPLLGPVLPYESFNDSPF